MMPQRHSAPDRTAELGDDELVALARAGGAAAFRQIMQRNNPRLFRLVRGILKDDAEAEDALQETYVRAFAGLGGYAGSAALSTWLTRIALNEALGRLRRRRTMIDFDDIAEGGAGEPETGESALVIPFPLAQPPERDPEHEAARAEIRRHVERAIDDLPDVFRVAFVMRFVEQMSVEETAGVLGIPPETVKTRVHRAKRRLREALEERLAASLADTFPFAGARCARLGEAVLRRLGIAGVPPSGPA